MLFRKLCFYENCYRLIEMTLRGVQQLVCVMLKTRQLLRSKCAKPDFVSITQFERDTRQFESALRSNIDERYLY